MSHYYEAPAPPAPGVVDGAHRRMGAARLALPRLANAVSAGPFEAHGRRGVRDARSRNSQPRTFRVAIQARTAGRTRRAVRRYLQQPLPPADRGRGAEAARAAGCAVELPRAARVLRPAVLRLRHARPRAGARSTRVLEVLAPQLERGPVGRGARAGLPFRVPRRAAPALPRDARAARLATSVVSLARVPEPQRLPGPGAREGAGARPLPPESALGHAATTSTLLQRRRLRGARRPTPAAAACRARSATGPSSMRPRGGSPGSRCCRRLRRHPTRPWWRAGFPAASRSRASPARPTLHLAELLASA